MNSAQIRSAGRKEETMKRLALAVMLVLAGAVIVFVVLRFVLVDEELANSVYEIGLPLAFAGLVPGTITFVHRWLVTGNMKLNVEAQPSTIVSFAHYRLPWYVMVTHSVLIVYAVSNLGMIIIWSIGEVTGFYFSTAIAALNILLACIGFYFVGFWIGARCDRHPMLATIAVLMLYKIATATIALISGLSSLSLLIIALVPSMLLYLTVAVLGVWRGHRARLTQYLQYLFQFLEPQTRSVLVHSTFEEVKRLSASRIREVAPITQSAVPATQSGRIDQLPPS
jgi:hypothetical protein